MRGSLIGLFGSLVLALLACYRILTALNLSNPIPLPSSPRVVPAFTLPPDAEEDDKEDRLQKRDA
jgi:hypothetical protein